MSINNNDSLSYRIPKEIEAKIPDYFYIAMAGELCSVFGYWLFDKIVDPDDPKDEGHYNLGSSTAGWYEAFKATCDKLNMSWLMDYYKTLECYDSDIFDGIIENRIITNFILTEGHHSNLYYQYLCNKN